VLIFTRVKQNARSTIRIYEIRFAATVNIEACLGDVRGRRSVGFGACVNREGNARDGVLIVYYFNVVALINLC
jgi:hypothetical protein